MNAVIVFLDLVEKVTSVIVENLVCLALEESKAIVVLMDSKVNREKMVCWVQLECL